MPEITGLTVLIDGDISGITKAINEAKAEIDAFSSYTAVGYAGGDYTTAKKRYNYWADSGHINTNEKIRIEIYRMYVILKMIVDCCLKKYGDFDWMYKNLNDRITNLKEFYNNFNGRKNERI